MDLTEFQQSIVLFVAFLTAMTVLWSKWVKPAIDGIENAVDQALRKVIKDEIAPLDKRLTTIEARTDEMTDIREELKIVGRDVKRVGRRVDKVEVELTQVLDRATRTGGRRGIDPPRTATRKGA